MQGRHLGQPRGVSTSTIAWKPGQGPCGCSDGTKARKYPNDLSAKPFEKIDMVVTVKNKYRANGAEAEGFGKEIDDVLAGQLSSSTRVAGSAPE